MPIEGKENKRKLAKLPMKKAKDNRAYAINRAYVINRTYDFIYTIYIYYYLYN